MKLSLTRHLNFTLGNFIQVSRPESTPLKEWPVAVIDSPARVVWSDSVPLDASHRALPLCLWGDPGSAQSSPVPSSLYHGAALFVCIVLFFLSPRKIATVKTALQGATFGSRHRMTSIPRRSAPHAASGSGPSRQLYAPLHALLWPRPVTSGSDAKPYWP